MLTLGGMKVDDWFASPSESDGPTGKEAAEVLLTYAIAIAERGPDQVKKADYRRAHRGLMKNPVARRTANIVLRRCDTPDLMWSHLRSIATGSGSWALRRDGAHALLDPVLDAVTESRTPPSDALAAGAIERLDSESVRLAWTEALDRRESNPEGAVTMARTLLESTLKTILDDRGVEYGEGQDLPALYKTVSSELRLAPSLHTEQAFKQILGGCHSVVVGLGSLRNKAGDAHGAGRRTYRPASRHASLAVNLAGSMALFLIETHEAME